MKKANTLSYIDLLPHLPEKLKQCVRARTYARSGGVSQGPYGRLNLGLFSGDQFSNVIKNIEIVAIHMGLEPNRIVALKQVHGRKILVIKNVVQVAGMADGMVTQELRIGLLIQHADCGAIVFFDAKRRSIAAVHAGWRGLKEGAIESAIKSMEREFGSRTSDLWVGIAPTIGPCCYEFRGWQSLLPKWMTQFVDVRSHLDLKESICFVLEKLGIKRDKIYADKTCTCCSNNLFSYRRKSPTGRLGTLISLM